MIDSCDFIQILLNNYSKVSQEKNLKLFLFASCGNCGMTGDKGVTALIRYNPLEYFTALSHLTGLATSEHHLCSGGGGGAGEEGAGAG